MPDYETAMRGLQEVLDAIPRLDLDPREQAQVAHLIERTAFNTHNALMAAYGDFPRSTDLVVQMCKYSQLAERLDPDKSIREALPISR